MFSAAGFGDCLDRAVSFLHIVISSRIRADHELATRLLSEQNNRGWWREWEPAVLGLLVFLAYFTRLAAAPICGEESRWATAAREMIATGDWIVPRQQGTIFPERPPLTIWAMALAGVARDGVDLVAVRAPSACAVLVLTLLIYAYARTWMSRLASFSSAAIFATSGQVLALGRSGESEAVFTLFTAASLLVWHLGYLRRWRPAACWSAGYCLAALGALTKGLQPPIYFVAACVAYLAWQRDWRWLFCRGHLIGIASFVAIVAAWLVPFATVDWTAIDDIWAGLAQDRFTHDGLLRHVVAYPGEILGCLLPWSPLLLALVKPSVWRSLLASRHPVRFHLVALAVTFPSVWLAAGARGRYFMPLYPCLAIVMGLLVEHCTAVGASLADRLIWRRYLRALGLLTVVAATGVAVISLTPISSFAEARQPLPFLLVWFCAALFGAGALIWASFSENAPRPTVAITTVAGFLGLTYAGVIVNARVQGANDLTAPIAQIQQHMADSGGLVSLGRVYHRFSYCYAEPIRQVPWPIDAHDLPEDVSYFCFDHRPTDTDQSRSAGDGRTAAFTPGTLPFAWEKIAEIPCDPVKRGVADRTVVIGRVRRAQTIAQPVLNQPVRR